MSNFLIAVAVFLITVIGALFAIPYAIDWNGYRGVFEDEASRMLGREVRIGGSVNLHFLPTPYFSLEKVRIADASAALQEPFFRTESVTIRLSAAPLLRGVVEAHEIELRRPVLRLAIDKDDTWNWQGFAESWGNAAYLPSNVALSSVTIKDGLVALHGPDGQERTSFSGINAELSAPALDGPYRVKATFGKAGAERELRLATAAPEPDGAVRFKATLRATDSATSYSLDARVANLTGKVRVEGELNAKLPFASLWPTATRAAREEGFELKAQMQADAGQLALKDLALAFEHEGQPQIISGDLVAQWRNALAVETKLTSHWLDLDRMAGVGEGAGPLDSAIPFAMRMRDLLPAGGRSRASLSIEQANIGREAVSGLVLSMVRTGDVLEVEELRAAMPGGSRGELKGVLTGPAEASTFSGRIVLRGSSLARFTHWATAGALSAEGKTDGSFGVRAQVALESDRVALRDLSGELSGAALRGGATYRWGATREFGLQFEGPQLDARAFIPAGAGLGDMVALLMSGHAGAEAGSKAPARLGAADLSLRIRTGQLLTAGAAYRDVAVEIERKGGALRIPVLRLTGDDGFVLDLEGEVANTGTKPKGTLRMAATAEAAEALQPLAELLGIPENLRPEPVRLKGLVPLRLAGTMAFGSRLPTAIEVAAEGEAGGGKLWLSARLDGSSSGWRGGPTDITLSMENPDARAIASLILPATGNISDAGTPAREAGQRGRMLLRAGGVPSEGMTTLFTLNASDTAIAFRGRLTSKPEQITLGGDLDLSGADGSRVAALARLSPPLRLGEFPLSGSVRFTTDGRGIDVERLSLDVGGINVRGRMTLKPEGARQRVSAQIEADTLSVADLLAPLLDRRLGAATAAAEAALGDRPSVWPDQPFEARTFDAFVGDVTVRARRLALYGGLGLDQASARVRLGDGKVVVEQLEGVALGKPWSAAFSLAPLRGAGAELSGTVQVQGVPLGSAVRGANGVASAKLAFIGRGANPRAVLASLQGQGAMELQSADVPGITPKAISLAVDASFKASNESAPQALRKTLATGLASAPLPLPQSVGLELADGQLRSKATSIETPAGIAEGSVLLDLSSFALLSDWKLTDRALATPQRALPAVSVQYRGPIAGLGRLEPQIGLEALEREVTVRRMERDVDELERLRRLDEARRREDAERLREQLERAPAPPSPLPPLQPPPQPQAAPPRPQPPPQPKASWKSLIPW